jgi:tetratricopeptide (TPR) repeat protein
MDPYERALTLDPSPQQRLRIGLNLAPLQSGLGRGKQAYAIYQGLLRDYPDYPDKIGIYQKIIPLAEKFGKPEDKAEYEKALKELTPAAPPQKT